MTENHVPSVPRAEKLSETRRKGLTRRQLAAGTAWSVPVVAASVAAPAFGSSPACTNGEQSWTVPGVYTFVVPAGCNNVEYSIAGAQGGLAVSSGSGALFTGNIVRDGTVPLPLTIVVGAAGESGQPTQVWKGGVGYGNGGDTSTAPSRVNVLVGAGGGGSAILDGITADVAANPPMVVAGGGGGGNWGGGSGLVGCQDAWIGRDRADGNIDPPRPGPGNAGLNGEDASQERTLWVADYGVSPPDPIWWKLSVNGGKGASGATGGAPGALATATLIDPAPFQEAGVPEPMHREYVGTAGGDHGTGNFGGGNGGTGALPWGGQDVGADETITGNMTSGSGGGGGWAGGGGGGNAWAFSYQCAVYYSFQGGGGGASSYTGGSPNHRVVVATSGTAPRTDVNPPNDGAVTIRW